MPFNITKKVKNSILNFVREYYDKDLQYADPLLEKWRKKSVVFFMDVLFSGISLYLVLASIKLILPLKLWFVNLGTKFWHIPIIVGALGLSFRFCQRFYEYVRQGYKVKK